MVPIKYEESNMACALEGMKFRNPSDSDVVSHQQQSSGVLDQHSVVTAKTTCSKAKWLCIALIVVAVVSIGIGVTGFLAHQGKLPTALAKLHSLGALGKAGSIAMMAGGSILMVVGLGELAGTVGLLRKNRNAMDSGSREARTKDMSPLAEADNAHNTKVHEIGSKQNLLGEVAIQHALRFLQSKNPGDIDALVIYGNGSVEFNLDPGIIALNPKKLILVGARIVHRYPTSLGLDDSLVSSEKWLVKRKRDTVSETFIVQMSVSTINQALSMSRPQGKNVVCLME